MEEKNYEHLEGKEVTITHISGKIDLLKVIGIEEGIGMTLARVEDITDNRICLNGPLSPKFTKDSSISAHQNMFNYLVKAIEEGHIDGKTLTKIKQDGVEKDFGVSGEYVCSCEGGLSCAFS